VEPTRKAPVADWLETVAAELKLIAREREWPTSLELDTLYVGGGTPSLLGPGAMEPLRRTLAPQFELTKEAEWAAEANPESFSTELAADWAEAGVNRVSIGVQSFDAKVLRWMGRLHGPEGARRAMVSAREAGFRNVSLDLIFGLPERLGRDWNADLEAAVELSPDHISLYGLTAEAGAPLGRRVNEGREVLLDEERYAEEYLVAAQVLVAAGFEHYEVSSFARPGHRSRHNAVYWRGRPYAAIGVGAHAFYPPRRRWNIRSWSGYQEALRAGQLPLDDEEEIDSQANDLERIWLALRTAEGYELEGSRARRRLAEEWAGNGLAVPVSDVVRLTPEGWLLLDRLALEMHSVEVEAPEERVEVAGGEQEF
jgi:oxygen-independent coproporphyrinogen III oxidase